MPNGERYVTRREFDAAILELEGRITNCSTGTGIAIAGGAAALSFLRVRPAALALAALVLAAGSAAAQSRGAQRTASLRRPAPTKSTAWPDSEPRVSVMTAEDLKTLYETELRCEVDNLRLGSEERQGLRQLLCASSGMGPGELREHEHPGVWLWSDLHLGHAMALSVFGRPYWTPEEMDDDLFGAWRRVIDPGHTVVILDDVAMGGLSGRRLKRLLAAPGRKVLVVGNHEFDNTVEGHLDGFDEVFSAVYVPGTPELLADTRTASPRSRRLRDRARASSPMEAVGNSAHQCGGRAGGVSAEIADEHSSAGDPVGRRRAGAGADNRRATDAH